MQRVWRKTPCFDLPWSSCLTKIHHSIPFWKHCQCTPRQQCKPEYLFGFPINWFEILVMLITWDGKDYEVKAGAGELQGHGTTRQEGLNQFTKDLQNKRSFQPAFNKEKIIVADFWCSGREGHTATNSPRMFSPSSSILEFSLTFYCLARAWLLLLGWWSCYRGSLPHLLLAAPRIAIKQQLANIYIILCNTAHSNTAARHGTLTATAFSFTFTLTILHCWQRIVLTSRKLNLSAIFSGDAWSLLKCPLH